MIKRFLLFHLLCFVASYSICGDNYFKIRLPIIKDTPTIVIDSGPSFNVSACQNVLKITAGAVGLMGLFVLSDYIYNAIKNYYENKVIDKTVDAIVTILTPYARIQLLPAQQQEKIVREKARFINMRKRILARLQAMIEQHDHNLSVEHRDILHKDIKRANLLFTVIDAVRRNNEFEDDYQIASGFDSLIEDSIIKSIIASTKPLAECNEQELQEKELKKQRKKKIMQKLKNKLNNVIAEQLMQSSLFFHMLWV